MTENSDSQGNKLEKKKLHKKSKRPRDCETSNGGDDSVVTEERQGKKMKLDKVFSKEDGRTEDEDHDQGKKKDKKKKRKKEKKLSEETKPDDRGKEMKKNKKEKLIEESKSEEEYNKLRSNEGEDGDQGKKKKKNKKEKLIEESKSEEEYNQLRSNEGEDGDQGKKMKKKKKLSDKSKSKNSEFNSNEGEDNDRGKEMKKNKKKRSIEESKSKDEYNKLRSNEGEDGDQGKKMKKKKLSDKSKSKNSEFNSNDGGSSLASVEEGDAKACGDVTEVDDQSKKKKTKKKAKEGTDESTIPAAHGEKMKKKKLSDKSKSKISEFNSNEGDPSLASVEEGDAKACGDVDDQSKKKKTKKKAKAGTDESTIPAAHGETSKPKRVTFSDQVEVYGDQVEVCGDQVEVCGDDDLVRGKRFTPEEDEKIKEAVSDYIESHGLGDEGLKMILHCMSHPEVRGCWKEIGEALPHRPHQSVYYRAHIIYERDEARKWTPEELDFLLKAQDQHGSDWKLIAEALNKHRLHVKDTWRRIRRTNANTGRWSQDEYQRLFDLVNKDLCARAAEDCRKNKHGMLRDNVSWEAISDEFGSRASALCCMKWYQQLTSPMVADGIWSDTDDYRLVNALYALDACSMEEVDWDNLLEHRSGDVCRKRWHQMVRNIREYAGKSFAEQVEILSKRYRPDLVEAREAFDSKPVVG